jgi:hypothetical protein
VIARVLPWHFAPNAPLIAVCPDAVEEGSDVDACNEKKHLDSTARRRDLRVRRHRLEDSRSPWGKFAVCQATVEVEAAGVDIIPEIAENPPDSTSAMTVYDGHGFCFGLGFGAPCPKVVGLAHPTSG